VYSRIHLLPEGESCFLFGPRGTGKSSFVLAKFPEAPYFDLLDSRVASQLAAQPSRIEAWVPKDYGKGHPPIVIDEVQKVPDLLDEVHRLIERKRWRFVLTGSSARKLRRAGTNLLAGRAITRRMHPLTVSELGKDFDLAHAVRYGFLPSVWVKKSPASYLATYTATYLREEVLHEGITRNLGAFARFLEASTLSQGSVLSISETARECAVERKVVEGWYGVLEDLMLAVRLPVFTRKAKRATITHPKFYLFDAGVYRSLRPRGPLDSGDEIDGAALETVVLQQIRALNDQLDFGYSLYYWRTPAGLEVDFVLYGERGLLAIEVKRSRTVRPADLRALREFKKDYPAARPILFYGGSRREHHEGVDAIPIDVGLKDLPAILEGE
jgi:uncharacterized protein